MCPPLEYEYNKVTLCDFPRLGHKRPRGFCFWDLGFQKLPLRTPLTNQLPCVRSPATSLVFKSSQSWHPTCEWRSLLMILSPTLCIDPSHSSLSNLGPRHHGVKTGRLCCTLYNSWTYWMHKHSKIFIFYASKFGVVCYAAVEVRTKFVPGSELLQ